MASRFYFILISIFISYSAVADQRFVIRTENINEVYEHITTKIKKSAHKLKYHSAVSATLNSGELKEIEGKFPKVRIEEDHLAFLLGHEIKGKPSGNNPSPAQVTPWGINATQSREAHSFNRGGGVRVCVVDTGIEKNHSDLFGQVVAGENFVIIKGKIDPQQYNDDNGHGTHVAGTIAALDNSIGVVGVAPDAKLIAVKVLNRQGSGYTSDVADGVLACIRNNAHVINMSLGSSSYSSILHEAIKQAYSLGISIVAAAGNESRSVSYPAALPEVIAVTAVDSSMKLASFSNFGPEVDYAAPGVAVLSTVKGNSYATYSGTSMASPHIAGVMALKISSQSLGLVGVDIGLLSTQQGNGFINSLLTIINQ